MNKIEKYQICPDENELAMFVEGTLTGERLLFVKRHLEVCSLCNEAVRLTMELNAIEIEHPFVEMEYNIVSDYAAQADRKLCVIYTEQYILQQYGIAVSIEELLTIAKQNKWIKHQGIQFKNIGKLLEYHSIQVERKTDASLADLQKALQTGHYVMVGVDAGELFAQTQLKKLEEEIEDWFDEHADHVLLVKSLHITNDTHDTAELINIDGKGVKALIVPLMKFLDAWEDSGNFMVEALND
jgi:hypothetical protein